MSSERATRYVARRDLRLRQPITLPGQYMTSAPPTPGIQDPASSLVAGLASFNKALLRFLEAVPHETPTPVPSNSQEYAEGMKDAAARREQVERGTTASIIDMASRRTETDFSPSAVAGRLAGTKLGIREDHVFVPWLGVVGRKGSTL